MKRTLLTIAAVIALVALCAAPAFAEGYNSDGTVTPLVNGGEGVYVRDLPLDAGQVQNFMGPHGGYTTTTNKCQDCHSTHYAYGSYKLLRANEAAAACDYCHGGGGGSSVNIMMDNDYRAGEFDPYGDDGQHNDDATENMAPVAITDPTGVESAANDGYGTGHTLGYKGLAPADIEPAFSDSTDGLACFSCHSPHGNSARILKAFGSPSKPAGDGNVTAIYGVSFMDTQMWRIQEQMKVDLGISQGAGPGQALFPADGDFTKVPNPAYTKRAATEAPTEIGAWVEANLAAELTAVYSDNGTPANPMDDTGAFPAWMADPDFAPTPAQMGAWFGNAANFAGDTNGDGYKEMNFTGMQALFALFGVTMDGTGAITDPGTLYPLFSAWNVYWGIDVTGGNIDTCFMNMGDWQNAIYPGAQNPLGYNPIANPELEVWHKPLFPAGKFMLLKNPDSGDDYTYAEGGVSDIGWPAPDMKIVDSDGPDNIAGNADDITANEANGKKVGIDWDFPLGPAASWGPFFYTDNNERFPLAFPWAPMGVAMENEMCTSCHDGSAGMAVQSAKVYNSTEATYVVAYSHDSNSRGCARAQYINTEQDDTNNFGPHCANCHTGASGCRTCHSADGENWTSFGRSAYTTDPNVSALEGITTFKAPAAVRTSAVANINGKCLDGGFSYPHRTLGANMLKDNLYGVNFDGTVAAMGTTRTTNGTVAYNAVSDDLGSFFDADAATGQSFESTAVLGMPVQNLDSVCIDCHGDASYWNGDASDEITFTSFNPLSGGTQSWTIEGWQLLLKGLP